MTPAEDAPDDHDHEGHDHDHDHEGHDHDHDHEVDEEELKQAEADVARMGEALAALDDDALHEGLAGMSEKTRGELAAQLNMPRATMHLGDALAPLVRRKLRSASPDRQLQATFAIVHNVNDDTVAALGDRSDDPSREDLLEVLPAVVEKHGAPLVTAMLAGYAASDAPCRPAMRSLLDDDERFAIGPPVELDELASAAITAPEPVDEKALAAKREQRRAAKDAKRAAEARARENRVAAEAKRRADLHGKRKAR
jgi:hypothetical protein